jgi:hypothetical protein
MSEELRKRLERLRAQLIETHGSSPNGFLPVLIYGGLTPMPAIAFDDVGGGWIRNIAGGETVEDFARRAASASCAAGAKLCTIGGMGNGSDELTAALKAASDHYYEHEYQDVPPCETRAPARSRLGYSD